MRSTAILSATTSRSQTAAPVIVVIEGVFMYLEEETIRQLLQTLRRLFPQHKLICDLMAKDFFQNFGKSLHEKITGMGTSFKFTVDTPEAVFLENGYRRLEEIPIVEKSVLFSAPGMPGSVWESIQPTLPQGYSIYVFEFIDRTPSPNLP